MKLKNIAAALAVMGASLASSSASAYIVQDAWSLYNGSTTYTSIGNLSLSGGVASVNQQVDAGGNPFVGAQFFEYGQIFSMSYVPENAPGTNDFLLGPAPSITALKVEFSGLSGTVTSFDSTTGALTYRFSADVGSIAIKRFDSDNGTPLNYADDIYTTLANLAVKDPSGGDLNDFFGIQDTAGQSTLFLNFTDFLNGFNIGLTDPYSLGIPTTYGGPEDLYLQVQTTNTIGALPSAAAPCAFDQSLTCKSLLVTSDGSADLFRVPEPGTLALAGLGLVGLAAIRRRKEVK